MNDDKTDRERDQILKRMLNTPPDPKVRPAKKKRKKRRARAPR